MTILFVVALGMPQALATGQADAKTAEDYVYIRVGFTEKIDSLNPFVGYSEPANFVYGLLYDSLMSMDEDFQVAPNLAKSWNPVPTEDPKLQASGEPFGAVWQYNLTHDASWSDGVPFTANDVVFTIDLSCRNFTSMWANQPTTYFMKQAEYVDPYTVRIHFFDRATGIPKPVAFGGSLFMPILPQHKLEGKTPYEIGFGWNGTFPSELMPIVGTGPFMAAPSVWGDWFHGRNITLLRNPYSHWATGYAKSVQLAGVVMEFFDNEDELLSALKTGVVDIASLSPEGFRSIATLKASGDAADISLFSGPRLDGRTLELSFNFNSDLPDQLYQLSAPNQSIRDPAVRQALIMATDKDQIVREFFFGLAARGSTRETWSSHWEAALPEPGLWPFDYSNANARLEAAGYTDSDGDGIRECTNRSLAVLRNWSRAGDDLGFHLLVESGSVQVPIADFLIEGWRHIGVNASIHIRDPTIVPINENPVYDLAFEDWREAPDPNEMLWPLTQAAAYGWNEYNYSNSSFEANYSLSVSAFDPADRMEHVGECQSIFYEDIGSIVLAELNQTYAWRTDTLEGWGNWSARPGLSLDNIWSGAPLLFHLSSLNAEPREDVPVYLVAAVVAAGVCAGVIIWVFLGRRQKGESP